MKLSLARFFLLPLTLAFSPNLFGQGNWISIQSSRFELVGDTSQDKARRLIGELERFHQTLEKLFGTIPSSAVPVTVIAFKNDHSFAPYKPLYQGKPVALAGYFQKGSDRNMIAVNTESDYSQALKIIYHEYTHLLTSHAGNHLPIWIREGIAEFYSNLKAQKNEVTVGTFIDQHLRELQNQALMPLEMLFSVTHDSSEYNESQRQGALYAQSWLTIHYLLTHNNGQYRLQFGDFLNEILAGTDQKTALRNAFGIEVSEFEAALKRYLQGDTFQFWRFKMDRPVVEESFPVREISEGEALAFLGTLLWHSNRLDEAKKLLEESLAKGHDSPLLHEGLGFIALRLQDKRAALDHFRTAVRRGTNNFMALLRTGELLYERSFDRNGQSDLDQDEEISRNLMQSIELMPTHPRSYHLLAHLYLTRKTRTEEVPNLLNQAIQLDPQNSEYLLTLAEYQRYRNHLSDSRSTLETVLERETNPNILQRARSKLEQIEAAQKDPSLTRLSEKSQGASQDQIDLTHSLERIEPALGGNDSPPDPAANPNRQATHQEEEGRPPIEECRPEFADVTAAHNTPAVLVAIDCADGSISYVFETSQGEKRFQVDAPTTPVLFSCEVGLAALSCGPLDLNGALYTGTDPETNSEQLLAFEVKKAN